MKKSIKKITLTFILIFGFSKAFTQSYNAINIAWLQNNIQQNKNKFEGKKLKILLDSLKKNKTNIADYDPPEHDGWGAPDTIKSNHITIYFNKGSLPVIIKHNDSFFGHSQRTDTLNTHVPFIEITFKNKVSFLRKWFDEEKAGIGSIKWNKVLEVFWGRQVVDKIEIGEY